MNLKFKVAALVCLSTIFAMSCSKGNTKPSYSYKAPVGDGVAAKIGDITITEKELLAGLESDLYDIDKKKFSLLISVITGLALHAKIAFASATNVKSGIMTSSFFLIPNAISDKCKAAVQLDTAIAYFEFEYLQKSYFLHIFTF